MKAWICRRYGGPDVLEMAEVPTPTAGPGEILIRIKATTVASGDWRTRSLEVPRGLGLVARLMMGINGPRQPILGTELAGTVEAVGSGVTAFRVGDKVLGFPGGAMGSHAQFRVMAADGPVVPMPSGLSFEEAASLPFGAMTALDFLRRAGMKAGDKVLVIGASGCVGSALVQLARHMGAHVTGVTSAGNLDLVRGLGAERVIDYATTDFTAEDSRYDIIADTVGNVNFEKCLPVLAEGGRFLAIAGGLGDMLATLRPRQGKRVIAGPASERREDLREVADLAASGALRPVIDSTYDFAEMPAAHGRTDSRRKRGSVVVRVE